MGIFNRQNKAAKPNSFTQTTPGQGMVKLWTKPPTKEKSELPNLAHQNPRLDPVSIIGKSIASTELLIYDKRDLRTNGDSAKALPEHEAYDLMDEPIKRYPEIDGYSMMFLTSALVDLTGEFGWLKLRDDSGKVIELNPIPSAWIMGVPTVGNPYYQVYPFGVTSGKVYPVKPADFVFFKRPDLTDPFGRGRGSAESIIDEVQTDELLGKMSKNLAYNDATPKTVITAPGITPENAIAFKASWMQKLGGWLHHGEPAIIPNDITVTKLSMTPDEMDYVESRRFLRDECLQHYQIPPEIYGILENSNRSTIDASYYLYHKNVLFDRYRFIERVITRQFIVPDFDKNLCVKFNEKVPEDEEFKLKVLSAGVDKRLVTRKEWRLAFKLPTSDKDDVYISPLNLFEVPINAPTPKPPKPEGEKEPIPEESPEKMFIRITDDEPIHIVEKSEKESRLDAIWKTFDVRATAHEGEFSEAVKRFAKIQEKLVLDALDVKSINEPSDDEKTLSNSIDKALETVFNDASNKALKSALAPAWLSTLKEGREHGLDMIGKKKAIKADVDPAFDVFNDLANDWIEKFGLIKAQEINTTTFDVLRKNLQANIAEAMKHGKTGVEIRKLIEETCGGIYETMTRSRAQNISRTESASAMNSGTFILGKIEGMTQKRWLSSLDSRTRNYAEGAEFDHVAANGEVVDIDKPFTKSGEEIMYPGSPEGSAGNVCMCRCSFTLHGPGVPLE